MYALLLFFFFFSYFISTKTKKKILDHNHVFPLHPPFPTRKYFFPQLIFRDRGRSKWAEFLLLSVTPDSLRSSIPCSTSTFSKSSPLPLPWEWPELWPPSHGSDSDNNVPMATYIYTITHFTRTRTHINSRISSLSPLIVFFVLQLKLIISKLTFFFVFLLFQIY